MTQTSGAGGVVATPPGQRAARWCATMHIVKPTTFTATTIDGDTVKRSSSRRTYTHYWRVNYQNHASINPEPLKGYMHPSGYKPNARWHVDGWASSIELAQKAAVSEANRRHEIRTPNRRYPEIAQPFIDAGFQVLPDGAGYKFADRLEIEIAQTKVAQ